MREVIPYRLTEEQLLCDLHHAYRDASRHKTLRSYRKRFQNHEEDNLSELCHELYNRTYRPLPSTCFIISDPKKREVFAADFRDRIVHHLYYNYAHLMLESTFIHDSYSCIPGRGTHYGIRRLEEFIRSESRGYSRPCYVLKMDIRGYFMNINRQRLSDICLHSLTRMATHRVNPHAPTTWQELVDMDFVTWLTRETALLDPTTDCIRRGKPSDWQSLPHSKSLFHSPQGCGLPIGNLTSQLFSNVYLNQLDQYMKRTLHCRCYGRYVDDFFVVSHDREWLRSLIPHVRQFLSDALELTLHEGKTRIADARCGVEFLGAYIKPWRTYISHQTLKRIEPKIRHLHKEPDTRHRQDALASYCGLMSHYSSINIRRRLGMWPLSIL